MLLWGSDPSYMRAETTSIAGCTLAYMARMMMHGHFAADDDWLEWHRRTWLAATAKLMADGDVCGQCGSLEGARSVGSVVGRALRPMSPPCDRPQG